MDESETTGGGGSGGIPESAAAAAAAAATETGGCVSGDAADVMIDVGEAVEVSWGGGGWAVRKGWSPATEGKGRGDEERRGDTENRNLYV